MYSIWNFKVHLTEVGDVTKQGALVLGDVEARAWLPPRPNFVTQQTSCYPLT